MTYLTEEAGRSEEEGGVFGGAASAESVEGAVDIITWRVSVAQVNEDVHEKSRIQLGSPGVGARGQSFAPGDEPRLGAPALQDAQGADA